jgi:CheY-like chemotaxis protein
VLQASSGHEALEIAERHPEPIDMLITDLRMPRMDGHELAEALHARHPALKVLFLTGFSEDLFKLRELLPNWAAYVDKPISPEALRQAAALMLYGTTNPKGPSLVKAAPK